jgi:hypothetical protein
MAGSDDDRGRSRRPGAKDHGYSSTSRVLGGQTIEMSDDTVCGVHSAQGTRSVSFLVEPQT